MVSLPISQSSLLNGLEQSPPLPEERVAAIEVEVAAEDGTAKAGTQRLDAPFWIPACVETTVYAESLTHALNSRGTPCQFSRIVGEVLREVTLVNELLPILDDGSPFSFELNTSGSYSESVFLLNALLTVTLPSAGDFDNDGDVDGRDFLIWQRQYTGPIPLASTAVPEPGVLVLVGAAVIWLTPLSRKSFCSLTG